MHNDKALVTGAAVKKPILERLPKRILEHMHTIGIHALQKLGVKPPGSEELSLEVSN